MNPVVSIIINIDTIIVYVDKIIVYVDGGGASGLERRQAESADKIKQGQPPGRGLKKT